MKKALLIATTVLLAMVSCNKSVKSPFARKVADYAVVTIEMPDLSGISDNGKEVLNIYRFIADEIDAIYWEQYFGCKDSLMVRIDDPQQKTFAQINYGPWDRTTGLSFVEGYAARLPGVGFYPADMTCEEFEAWDNPDKDSPYTLIRRAADGSLETVWYHDAYREHIDKIVNYLNAAADITIKPSAGSNIWPRLKLPSLTLPPLCSRHRLPVTGSLQLTLRNVTQSAAPTMTQTL